MGSATGMQAATNTQPNGTKYRWSFYDRGSSGHWIYIPGRYELDLSGELYASLNDEPGRFELLGEESFKFYSYGKKWRAARVTGMHFIVEDIEAGKVYSSVFTIEVGVPKIANGKSYSANDAVYYSTLVANSVATEVEMVSTFIGPSGRAMTLSSATLPYYFASLMQAKLRKYIPYATVTANTYNYKIQSREARFVNWWKGLFERLG